MMRKNKVATTAMNIDGLPQVRSNHCRALEVPTRSPSAPGAIPTGFLIGRGLPEHKIARMTLVVGNLDPGPCHHVLEFTPAELTVGGHGLNREQSVPVGLIGVPLGDQSLCQRDHVIDVLCGHRLNRGRKRIERRHILAIFLCELRADFSNVRAALYSCVNDLVVDIGDVAGVNDLRIEHT